MSRIDKMIEELAPRGVEFKTLGEIAQLVRGNGMPKTDLTDQGVGAIHYGQIYTRYGVWTTKTISFVSPETASKLAKAEPGDVIITNTSENVEDVGKAVAWLGNEPIVTGGHATVIKHREDPKYLSYWFQSESFYTQKKALATGTKVIDVSAKQLMRVRIPVPPLEVQREIAQILNQFTQLEAELEAELEARRIQYVHYRHSLVGRPQFANNEWVPLASIAGIRTGAKPDETSDSGAFPYINAGIESSGFTNRANSHGNVITIPSRGQGGAGHVGYQKDEFWCGPLCYRVESTSRDLLTRFLYFYLQNVQDELVALRKIGSIPAVNKSDLGAVLVPVVPLEKQQRVVEVLDQLDALVNDLIIGLPAELVARRKQYAYYRDTLLTFEEATV